MASEQCRCRSGRGGYSRDRACAETSAGEARSGRGCPHFRDGTGRDGAWSGCKGCPSFNFTFNSWTETLLAAGDFTPGHADKLVVTLNALSQEMEAVEDLSRNA
ncbi:unnamed protein product [Coccothraustes coccothraustes]